MRRFELVASQCEVTASLPFPSASSLSSFAGPCGRSFFWKQKPVWEGKATSGKVNGRREMKKEV